MCQTQFSSTITTHGIHSPMWYIFMLDVLGLFLLSGAYLLKLCFNTEIRAQLRLLCQLSSLSCKYKCRRANTPSSGGVFASEGEDQIHFRSPWLIFLLNSMEKEKPLDVILAKYMLHTMCVQHNTKIIGDIGRRIEFH